MAVAAAIEALNAADKANEQSNSSGGSNFAKNTSLIGGALDGLGASVTGWFDRSQQLAAQKQEQENFDKQFEENKRRFGLTFALQEWSTRKGLTLNEAQQRYNQSLGMRQSQTDLEKNRIEGQMGQISLDEAKRRASVAKGFLKGFANAKRSKKAWNTVK